ncbi:hypothetical protein glysoja_037411 [Glycine soja]|uniref:Uncharacterized protein n=1 Tax=Glycine soja TaxID=3848 RepID=A0A0B2QTC5_GLYSO|nr:hypothetical protein JHK87_012644 [Glycine soja]KHN22917.1 hypothetical protein glysoja_037411 [Glycine soja]
MKYTWKGVQELKPAMLMVLAQVAAASVNVLYKLALTDGMSFRKEQAKVNMEGALDVIILRHIWVWLNSSVFNPLPWP